MRITGGASSSDGALLGLFFWDGRSRASAWGFAEFPFAIVWREPAKSLAFRVHSGALCRKQKALAVARAFRLPNDLQFPSRDLIRTDQCMLGHGLEIILRADHHHVLRSARLVDVSPVGLHPKSCVLERHRVFWA